MKSHENINMEGKVSFKKDQTGNLNYRMLKSKLKQLVQFCLILYYEFAISTT